MVSSKAPAIKWTAPPAPSHVLKLIRSERDIQKALLIFESASNEYPSYPAPSPSSVTLLPNPPSSPSSAPTPAPTSLSTPSVSSAA
ncbi:hypothetical protein KFK09_008198 [Dendrobium nobile]|uniref:Uncharacterized protein n=1 Tax=Dendrobium nobile TaxID=94219 RepID=A0A8T3BQ85_DENNO|nr:hypothetical protein KFK09_008198 [Dendrobium nobile]